MSSTPVFADCADTCRQESDRVKQKYSACSRELPDDRGACYKEAEGLVSTVQTCMRICNTKGAKKVQELRNEAKSPKPQP